MERDTDNSLLDDDRSKTLVKQLNVLPEGQIVDVKWFDQNGISRSMLGKLKKHGLLKRLSNGIYARTVKDEEFSFEWEQVVNTLQKSMSLPVHVGGRLALEMQGIMHYVRVKGPYPVDLYSYGSIPKWIHKVESDGDFTVRNALKLFDEDAPGLLKNFKREYLDCEITVSSPPRAFCELIDLACCRATFHNVDMMMDLACGLDSKEIQLVLESCKSVKVRRVFLFFAERNGLEWFKDLNLKRIDLGSGARQIFPDGEYVPAYKITVPRDLDSQAGYTGMKYLESDVEF